MPLHFSSIVFPFMEDAVHPWYHIFALMLAVSMCIFNDIVEHITIVPFIVLLAIKQLLEPPLSFLYGLLYELMIEGMRNIGPGPYERSVYRTCNIIGNYVDKCFSWICIVVFVCCRFVKCILPYLFYILAAIMFCLDKIFAKPVRLYFKFWKNIYMRHFYIYTYDEFCHAKFKEVHAVVLKHRKERDQRLKRVSQWERNLDRGKEKENHGGVKFLMSDSDTSEDDGSRKKQPAIHYQTNFNSLHKRSQKRHYVQKRRNYDSASQIALGWKHNEDPPKTLEEELLEKETLSDKIYKILNPEVVPQPDPIFYNYLRPMQPICLPWSMKFMETVCDEPVVLELPDKLSSTNSFLSAVSSDNLKTMVDKKSSAILAILSSLCLSAYDADKSSDITSKKSLSTECSKVEQCETDLNANQKEPEDRAQWSVKVHSDSEISFVKQAKKEKIRGVKIHVMETKSDLPVGPVISSICTSSSSELSGGYGRVKHLDSSSSSHFNSHERFIARNPNYKLRKLSSESLEGGKDLRINTSWRRVFDDDAFQPTTDLNTSTTGNHAQLGQDAFGITVIENNTGLDSLEDPFNRTVDLNSSSSQQSARLSVTPIGETDLDSLVWNRNSSDKNTESHNEDTESELSHNEDTPDVHSDQWDADSEASDTDSDVSEVEQTDENIIASSLILRAYYQVLGCPHGGELEAGRPLYLRYAAQQSLQPLRGGSSQWQSQRPTMWPSQWLQSAAAASHDGESQSVEYSDID